MFGFSPSTFTDTFDTNKTIKKDRYTDALNKASQWTADQKLGGAATGVVAKSTANDIMRKAGVAANRTANNAAGISGIFNAVGSIGSFGAAGGFGNFGATEGINPTTVVDSFGGQASGQAGNDFFVDASGAIRPNPT
jgi:hypothetical protein